jgi:sugar phosphate permease
MMPGLRTAVPPAAPISSFLQVVREGRLWWPGIAAFFQGVVKDGIGLWIPTLLFLRYDLSLTGTVGYVLLIPLFNLAGVLIAGHLGKTWKVGEGMVTVFLFALAAAVLAFLAFASSLSVMLAAFLIGCASGLSYGTNYILLSLIPLKCAKTRRSSSVAGSLDFCSYFGAGAASIFIGMTDIRRYSSSIFLLWFFAALAGMAAMLIHARLGSRPHNPRPDRPAPRA